MRVSVIVSSEPEAISVEDRSDDEIAKRVNKAVAFALFLKQGREETS